MPAHALNGSVAPPVAKMAAEDYNREGIVRAPPSVRAAPSAALRPVIPERALELVVPESEPQRAAASLQSLQRVTPAKDNLPPNLGNGGGGAD